MQKLFDKILSEKIKTVFNDHQESYNPADWEKLKAQLSGKKRGLVIWLNIAKAASVVLFVGVSTFYANRNGENLQSEYIMTDTPIEESSTESVNAKEKEVYQLKNESVLDSLDHDIKYNKADEIIEIELVNDIVFVNQNDSVNLEKTIVHVDSGRNDSLKQIMKPQLMEQEFELVEKKRNQKIDFSIAVASMYSYSLHGTEGQVNMGGGFTTAYNISKKFSISSGMIIAQQSLDYYDTQSLAFANMSGFYEENTTMVNDPATAKTKIEFVGIDIPLNIRYKIKSIIITTGISSLIFVSEKRTHTTDAIVLNTSFNSTTNSYETVKSFESIKSEDNSPAFNRFDFASLFNISVGYKVPLKKGGILVEPFLKYPLGEISSANLKIGSGGLSLHYYF